MSRRKQPREQSGRDLGWVKASLNVMNPGPTGSTAPDEVRRKELRRMKLVATSMLIVAAIVYVVAKVFAEQGAWVGYVEATAEAAMVGAMADWFAVTALFRHPLGLPIPHTAIIQSRKDAIGASLGGFVRDNFLTSEVISGRLEQADLARRLGDWLSQPEHARTVSAQSAAVVHGITEVLQDDLIQSGVEHAVVSRVSSVSVAPLVGKAIDVSIEGGQHQALLESTLVGLKRFVDENQETFRQRLYEESPWWVPAPIDNVVFDKIYTGVNGFLSEVLADPNHEMRADFHRRVVKLAGDLKTSPHMLQRGQELLEEALDHREVRAWSSTLWSQIKTSILEATGNANSQLRVRMDESLTEAGRSLQTDPELRAKIDSWIIDAVGYVADQFRHEVADLIASTVQRWDTQETADRLELQVGKDLQFIRINGTIIGGLAGFVIHAFSELVW